MPKSLAGQMALLIGLALLGAQLVNFTLLLNERQKLSLAQSEGPALARFAAVAANPERLDRRIRRDEARPGRQRLSRISLQAEPLVSATAERRPASEARLADALVSAGAPASEVRVTEAAPPRGRGARDTQMLVISARVEEGQWLNARLPVPRRDPYLAWRLGLSTALLYLLVLGATLLIAARLARPLRELTGAAERFEGKGDPVQVTPRGPEDLRRAITAFNAMSRRVVALLGEKDRMLGAIGHDLRTPLASLRIRAESMEPPEERARMVATIEEMAAMLEDILALARSGRSAEEIRPVDIAALTDALTEEYRDLGRPVTFAPAERRVLSVQPALLRRALRNLIDNALLYAGSAEIAVEGWNGGAEIRVEDRGPGIAPEALARITEPFYRVESSRSRETGGSGLGLAIARAVAEGHGGSLHIANREGGGLIAAIRLPKR